MGMFCVEEKLKQNKSREIIKVAELLGFPKDRTDRIVLVEHYSFTKVDCDIRDCAVLG